jgi:hypothetical protein
VDFEEREMSCGWCLIDLSEMKGITSSTVVKQQLKGGSPFSGVKIKSEEVSARRRGWRSMVQKIMGSGNIVSEITFGVTPFSRLSATKQGHISMLPSNILCAMSWVPLIRSYREYVAVSLHASADGPTRSHAPNQNGAFCNEIIAMFPKIVSDPAMITALTAQWYQQKLTMKKSKSMGISLWKNPYAIADAFTNVVYRLWLASCATAAKIPTGRTTETYDQVMERSEVIKAIYHKSTTDNLNTMGTAAAEGSSAEEGLFATLVKASAMASGFFHRLMPMLLDFFIVSFCWYHWAVSAVIMAGSLTIFGNIAMISLQKAPFWFGAWLLVGPSALACRETATYSL